MTFAARMTTAADIVALFEEYSIECGDGVLGDAGTTIAGEIRQQVLENPEILKHNVVHKNDRITFIELRKSTTGADQAAAQTASIDELAMARGGAITEADFPEVARRKLQIDASYLQTNTIRGKSTLKSIVHAAPSPAAVPCYFLPWNPTGGAVELTIPDRDGPASNANPILFLTAALSGCSVYVKGPAAKPTIFHCGTQHETVGSKASLFWDSVMKQLGHDPEDLSVVHNKDYTVPKRGDAAEMKEATRRQETAKSVLQKTFKSTLDVEEVSTWGSVFGVRDGRSWMFYMQENCTVTYHKIRKSKHLGRRISDGPPRIYSRPMFCRQIFPAGGSKAECFRHLRQLKV